MSNFINKIKDMLGQNKNNSELKNVLKIMKDGLSETEKEADAMYGEKFFPDEKTLSTEEMHYETLELENKVDFEIIQTQYQILKKKYSLEQLNKDEDKYKQYAELNARLDYAYEYFKNKFGIN